jgi:glutamate-1-semialdehyde 2,1-aminomutase
MLNEPVMDHVFGLGERVATGLREIVADLGVEATVAQFGSTFITYFGEGPFRNYEDVLRVDGDLLVDYRLRQLQLGVLETPMNPKGSKISYAHTAADIDRLLETTRESLAAALRDR